MYEDDSFHTLTLPGQIGLLVLSISMSVAFLWLAAKIMRRSSIPLRIVLALVLFFAFVWLAPQAYYTYYMTIFDGLPWQSVIRAPPNLERLARLLSFSGPATLSAHGLGALGWLLIVMALVRPRVAAAHPKDDRA